MDDMGDMKPNTINVGGEVLKVTDMTFTAYVINDDEWETLSDAWEGECEACGEVRWLKHCGDPFVAEGIIDGDMEETHAWCYKCFDTRCMDV